VRKETLCSLSYRSFLKKYFYTLQQGKWAFVAMILRVDVANVREPD
jgi:hypothetical protein